MKLPTQAPTYMASRQSYSAVFIQFIIAPILSLFSGFHTMDFIVGGLYTWPQMSRVIVLTFAVIILCYEFVYKEHRGESLHSLGSGVSQQGLKAVLYSCFLPYGAGVLVLLALVIISQ